MSEHPNAFIGTYFYFSHEDSLNFINILVKAYLVLRLCTYICNVLGYADNLLSWCNNSFPKLNTKRFCPFSWHQKISHFISAFIISWIVQRQIPFGTVFWTSNLIIYLIKFYFNDLRIISTKSNFLILMNFIFVVSYCIDFHRKKRHVIRLNSVYIGQRKNDASLDISVKNDSNRLTCDTIIIVELSIERRTQFNCWPFFNQYYLCLEPCFICATCHDKNVVSSLVISWISL